MDALEIDGAWLFTPRVHADRRGSFCEWLAEAEMRAAAGYRMDVAQGNCSVSRHGVIRGIHFADVPPGQAKYVSCLAGEVLDVIVDLRVGSPGFGRWTAVPLDGLTRRAVFISEGLGHGFVTLSEEATVLYLCSVPYSPGREHGVHPLDPGLDIDWGIATNAILSDKDAAAPTLEQALCAGLLPDYDACRSRAAELRGAVPRT
jgi:dTDP-4-dehydrorhamnose 3,5-epimerase